MNRGLAIAFGGAVVFTLWSILHFQNSSAKFESTKSGAIKSFDLLDEAAEEKTFSAQVISNDEKLRQQFSDSWPDWKLEPVDTVPTNTSQDSDYGFEFERITNRAVSIASIDELILELRRSNSPRFSLERIHLIADGSPPTQTSANASNGSESWKCEIGVRCLVPKK